MSSGKAFVCIDRLLDNYRPSPTYLRTPEIAQCVVDAMKHGETSYSLHAWVVMPNHVHLLITPHLDVPMLLQKLKGSTARQANKLLGRTGTPFWQEESYDHLVRSSQEFGRIETYIVENPVQAGLAQS